VVEIKGGSGGGRGGRSAQAARAPRTEGEDMLSEEQALSGSRQLSPVKEHGINEMNQSTK
jgi:hypothetical protein